MICFNINLAQVPAGFLPSDGSVMATLDDDAKFMLQDLVSGCYSDGSLEWNQLTLTGGAIWDADAIYPSWYLSADKTTLYFLSGPTRSPMEDSWMNLMLPTLGIILPSNSSNTLLVPGTTTRIGWQDTEITAFGNILRFDVGIDFVVPNHPLGLGGTTGRSLSDGETVHPFTGLTVTDRDYQAHIVAVTVKDGILRGDFTGMGGWSRSVVGSDFVYTRTFGVAGDNGTVIQNALQSLVFLPKQGSLPAGVSETTDFSVAIEDGGVMPVDSGTIRITRTNGIIPPVVPPVVLPTGPGVIDYSFSTSGCSLVLPDGDIAWNALGGSGDDILIGNRASNILDGRGGNDQLWGNGGTDCLIGGRGSNAFWWGWGDGQDRIIQGEESGRDAIYLYNVDWSGYNAHRQGNTIRFLLGDGSTLDVENWYGLDFRQRIQGFVFANHVVAAWNDGAGAEVNLYEPCYGANLIHMVQAFDPGGCVLRGSQGADTLAGGIGNDILWGNAGDDILAGGGGADTYWFGPADGHDVIGSNSGNREDLVNLYSAEDPSSITRTFQGNHLILQWESGATLTLEDWRLGGGYQLQRFRMGDRIWCLSEEGWRRE